jgi:hypothetical protein
MSPLARLLSYPHDKHLIGYQNLNSAEASADKLIEAIKKMRSTERKMSSSMGLYNQTHSAWQFNKYLKRKSLLATNHIIVDNYLHQIQNSLKS